MRFKAGDTVWAELSYEIYPALIHKLADNSFNYIIELLPNGARLYAMEHELSYRPSQEIL